MAVFVIAASPLAAQDAAPVAADVREPTADEKARIDDAWRSISYRIGTGYWTGVLEKLDEIQPLVAATYGADHPGSLQLRLLRADALAATSRFAEAEAAYAAAGAVVERRLGDNSPAALGARLSRAGNLVNLGRLTDAAGLIESVAASSVGDALFRASVDANLAYLRRLQGRFGEAEGPMRRALAVREAGLAANAIPVAVARAGLARTLTGLGRPAEAEEMARSALAAYPRDDLGKARLLFALGEAQSEQGRPQEAAQSYHDASKLFLSSQGYDFPETLEAGTLSHIAKAESLGIEQSLDDVPGSGGRNCDEPARNLADLWRMREYGAAESRPRKRAACFASLRAFAEQGFGAASPLALEMAERQLEALIAAGDSDRADAEARSLFPAVQQVFGRQHPATERAGVLFVKVLLDRGREEEARALVDEMSGPGAADGYRVLAGYLDSQGRFAEAEIVWDDLLAEIGSRPSPGLKRISDAIGGKIFNLNYQNRCDAESNAALIKLTDNLGWLAFQSSTQQIREARAVALACEGRWPEAVEAYDQAVFNGGVVFQDPAEALYHARKAITLARNPKYLDKARLEANQAALIARERRYTPDRDAEGRPLGYRRTRAAGIDPLAIAFAAEVAVAWAGRTNPQNGAFLTAFEAAQDYALSGAAASLLENAARSAVRDPALGALIDRQVALASEMAAAEKTLADGDDPAVGARLRALQTELGAATDELRRNYPAYAEASRPFGVKLNDLRARLRQGEALLLIQPVGQDIYSFAVSREAQAWNKAAIGERETGELVARIRCRLLPADCARSFDDARLFDAPAAAKLYRELVAPVEAGLGDASLVYAVTSGALGSIPLGVLISEPGAEQAVAGEGAELAALAEAKWLGDRFALATLPSVSSLRAFDRAAAGAPGVPLAGVGDPTLGPPIGDERKVRSARVSASRSGSGLADVFALRRLPSLPGTRRELLALAETLGAGDTALLMGGAASEGAVKRWSQLNEARVVAFATHAALPSEVDGLAEPGLVLTPPPAASPIDDGYLSASEAAALHLSADMVILSACNTAGPDGRSRGESLSGLARAFLFAGARSMLVSHWVVSDEVGPAITGEMFRILAARPATARAEALRLALRGVRSGTSELGGPVAGWKANWADPWAWAPFVLVESGS